jgi:hypothetical protein
MAQGSLERFERLFCGERHKHRCSNDLYQTNRGRKEQTPSLALNPRALRKYGSELLRALKAVRLPDKQRGGIEFGFDDESGGTDSDDEF